MLPALSIFYLRNAERSGKDNKGAILKNRAL